MVDGAVSDRIAGGESTNTDDRVARPFIKWAGGKSQLLRHLRSHIPKRYGRYWEPFIGGGALFFSVAPQSAVICDVNEELISTYEVVRDSVEDLICELQSHTYDSEHFYSVRSWDRDEGFGTLSPVRRAGRFIYLNKTCFNGLYRVNSKGHFNVPCGKYTNPRVVDADNLRWCSEALQRADIRLASYLSIEPEVQVGDFVYFDPPYMPVSATASFTSYTKEGFNFEDQVALRDLCQRLVDKGAHICVSNSASPFVESLYQGFRINTVDATRAINSKADKRGTVQELIITNQ
jgi:DNA adenine methylase